MTVSRRHLELSLLPERFSISRLSPDAAFPAWVTQGTFYSVTRTRDEVSIVTEECRIPAGLRAQPGWRVLKVQGTFALSEVGVMAALTAPLADASVSLFVLSTFDTDYLLVTQEQLTLAIVALERAGHSIQRSKEE